MQHLLINIAVSFVAIAMAFAAVVFLIFAVDATFGRFFGWPRLVRHRGSGPLTVVGEMGVLVLLFVGAVSNFYKEFETPLWIIVVGGVGLVMGFIGQVASEVTADPGQTDQPLLQKPPDR